MKNSLLICTMLLLAFSACKKDDTNPTDNTNKGDTTPIAKPSAFDYLPNTKGSYWEYETYFIRNDGKRARGNNIKCYVTGDTLIDGITYTGYYNFSPHNYKTTVYLANFNGQLRNNYGMVYFNVNKPQKTIVGGSAYTIPDTIYTTTRSAEKVDTTISVPAGSFSDMILHKYLLAMNPKIYNPDMPVPVTEENYFAKGVGMVKQEYYEFHSHGDRREWLLVDYHIAH